MINQPCPNVGGVLLNLLWSEGMMSDYMPYKLMGWLFIHAPVKPC